MGRSGSGRNKNPGYAKRVKRSKWIPRDQAILMREALIYQFKKYSPMNYFLMNMNNKNSLEYSIDRIINDFVK